MNFQFKKYDISLIQNLRTIIWGNFCDVCFIFFHMHSRIMWCTYILKSCDVYVNYALCECLGIELCAIPSNIYSKSCDAYFILFWDIGHISQDIAHTSQNIEYACLLYICYKIHDFCIPDMNTCTCPLSHPFITPPLSHPFITPPFGTPLYFSCGLPQGFSTWMPTTAM